MKTLAVTTAVLAIFGGVIYWNVCVWQECRTDHTFWYCMRMVPR